MRLLEYSIVAGVMFGLFYAYMALGLNLIFGVLRIVNLAHGDLVMLGSYLAFDLYYAFHLSPLLAVLVGVVPSIVLGGALYLGISPRLNRSADPEMLSLVLFFGISQVIEALATLGFSNNQRSLPSSSLGAHPIALLGQSYPASLIAVALVSVPALVVVFVYLARTKLGRATRAVMSSREEALVSGIDVRLIAALTFGVGVATAVGAGTLAMFMIGGVNPSEGVSLTVISFAVIVIGGLGNPVGTVAGGLVFGLASQLSQAYVSSWAGIVPYVLLLAVVLVKPSGIMGKAGRLA